MNQDSTDVLLISMPFGPLYSPSLGLTLLKESLIENKINVKIKYFTIDFAKQVGAKIYQAIASGYPLNHDLVGEWIFASSLYNKTNEENQSYIDQIVKGLNNHHSKAKYTKKPVKNKFIRQISNIQKSVADWIDLCLLEVIKFNPKIIGFTSIFQQQMASLYLAKRIKAYNSSIIIIFGGANVEGIMGIEYIKQYSFIDIVVSGEGDKIFPKLIRKVLAKETFTDLQGVTSTSNVAMNSTRDSNFNVDLVRDMDSLPYPNYDDYFTQLTAKKFKNQVHPRLLFESSRGCWWGEIMHCTFCGLNGENMKHRSKSADRALKELKYLAKRYKSYPISVVDNILDMGYFKTLIPELIKWNKGKIELFYEVKANLKKEQVELLKLAGITTIQPGIESLNDNVLKLMRKGVKSLQNIQLLIWCKEFGIKAEWNILWGFPKERPEDYFKMIEVIPLLSHLRPPHGASPIRLDRFSPNFDTPETLGFKNLDPFPTYEFIFPFEKQTLRNLAYYFTFDYIDSQNSNEYTEKLSSVISNWKQEYSTSDLFFIDKQTLLLIWDFRKVTKQTLLILKNEDRIIFLSSNRMRSALELLMICNESGLSITLDDVNNVLSKLIENKIMISDGTHFLSLAIPLNKHYSPNTHILNLLDSYIKNVGNYSTNNDSTVIDTKNSNFSLI